MPCATLSFYVLICILYESVFLRSTVSAICMHLGSESKFISLYVQELTIKQTLMVNNWSNKDNNDEDSYKIRYKCKRVEPTS